MKVSDVMLPIGQVDHMQRLRITLIEKTPDLANSILAVCHVSSNKNDMMDDEYQDLLTSSAAGFVYMSVFSMRCLFHSSY